MGGGGGIDADVVGFEAEQVSGLCCTAVKVDVVAGIEGYFVAADQAAVADVLGA
ncbi:hypothetical protein SALWKB12_0548 [Snodgrassella communis]|uniref:Uncharacterized protein n=1 Tax=Snodgrassella communis TaxID=2946699 RepID=A0A066TNT4_9NEIS|nr:hypothetical protein SALWKB12_2120 [Snodgrassella communis]KDN11803.1 hypothetical protein SALWKB12_1725 [Snodgrassella communis]KDN11974.1 hypothetical protein SALWKB12_1896 [Snodgrassella communis]KDN13693.1 hypothetical protein SALWKB12_0548 [Snodgrassella communis]KDN13736.1 hypothetical protein SALWKB29_2229 [Snodgrassella communis]